MGISYLIVTLALSNIQPDVVVRSPAFINDSVLLRESGGGLWLASGGNPWAAPDPDEEYRQGFRQRLPKPMSRPRYITPEELKSLEHVPQEFNGRGWAPPNRGLFENRAYTPPLYGGFGPYGQGGYPLGGGGYNTPLSPGINPWMSPYGGLPYGGMPYEGLSPFRY